MSANDNRTLERPLMTIDPESADRFINRELSWLAFNFRVLEEARNRTYPLLERLRFVSISSSNLDEFQMVRVAGLKGQMEAGVTEPSDDGRTPAQQLAAISQTVKRLQSEQQNSFRELRGELAAAEFHLVDDDALSAGERQWIEEHFIEQIFPALTPRHRSGASSVHSQSRACVTLLVAARRRR